MNFTIVMAFSRIKHVPSIKQTFKDATIDFNGTLKVVPVCDTVEQVNCWQDVEWADPILVLKKKGWFMGHWMLNVALDQLFPVENPLTHYCGTWTDDDAYENGFFAALSDRIEKAENPQVAAVSMRRWHHKSTPQDHLTADASHMHVCAVGLEQIYVRADVMQHYRYGNSPIADGFMVEQLYRECGKDFLFCNDLVVNWNRFV